jgi:hypothetical protein
MTSPAVHSTTTRTSPLYEQVLYGLLCSSGASVALGGFTRYLCACVIGAKLTEDLLVHAVIRCTKSAAVLVVMFDDQPIMPSTRLDSNTSSERWH